MKKNGSITIYLSLILLSVIILISVISETARINAVQAKSKSYTYMAAESVLAGYARQIYRDYGILLVWENEPADKQIEKYIQDNINGADLKGIGTNFMAVELVDVFTDKQKYVVDEGGKAFVEQIVSYVKYAGGINAAENLLKKAEEYSQKNKADKPNINDVTYIIDKNSNKLRGLVKNIDLEITNLKDTQKLKEKIDAASQKLKTIDNEIFNGDIQNNHNKNVKSFLGAYRKLIAELDMKAGKVHSTIILIKQYEEKKEQFLKESGYTSDVRDYIDEDLEKLEKAEDKIKENKELGVSKFSNIDSKNINIVLSSIKKSEEIQNDLESLSINRLIDKDKKNQSIYESAKAFLESGILPLVLEDISDISDSAVSDSNLPTKFKTEKYDNSICEDIKNKAVISVYAGMKFGSFLNSAKDSALKYELEYIINGEDNDRENLKKTAEKIVAARNVMSFAYIVTDTEKIRAVSAVAASAAATIGLPFMEPIIKGLLLEAWSFAEAVSDVKQLYEGEKIPVMKTKENWNTSLDNLGKSQNESYKGKKGMDYNAYLQMLICLEKDSDCIYRIMDLIQINIQSRYNKNFLLTKCFQELDVTANFRTKQVFTAALQAVKGFSENHDAYDYSIKCQYSY